MQYPRGRMQPRGTNPPRDLRFTIYDPTVLAIGRRSHHAHSVDPGRGHQPRTDQSAKVAPIVLMRTPQMREEVEVGGKFHYGLMNFMKNVHLAQSRARALSALHFLAIKIPLTLWAHVTCEQRRVFDAI